MNKLILTTALVALTALSACKKDSDVANTSPAAGDESAVTAPVTTDTTAPVADTTTTTTTTDTTTAPAATDTTAAPAATDSTTTTSTTTTTPTCGDHADLVGKNIADVDQAAVGASVRVIKPGDAVTEDFSASRVDIEVDADGKVTGVHCG